MTLIGEQRGQGLVEYALLLLLVFLVVIIILAVYGGQVANMFSQVTNSVGNIP